MEEEIMEQQQIHFVLVHGACHGAWSWYKLKPRLEAAGHRVTALDLSASGVNTKKLYELRTLHDYSKPLMEIMETINEEKVILVGHSLGGFSLALAMDRYPHKISLAVFVSAFMPDSTHSPSHVLDEYNARTPAESWLDTQFSPIGTLNNPLTSMFFGPKFVSCKLYQLSSIEDLALAKALIRPSSLFLEDLSKADKFSKEGYESVKRVYIVCNKDLAIPMEFQHWMIKNSPVAEVMEINGADHMPMCSKPQLLSQCLLKLANN